MNPFRWPFRIQCLAGFLVCAGLLAYAYYVQFGMGIEPCPMCIFQRIVFILLGIVFLVGAIHGPALVGRRVYGATLGLIACIGVGIAARHIWIQHQPPNPFAGCGPGLNYMVANFTWSKTLQMAFTGSADCAKISHTILGLSMPEWALISFFLLGAGGAWAGWRRR